MTTMLNVLRRAGGTAGAVRRAGISSRLIGGRDGRAVFSSASARSATRNNYVSNKKWMVSTTTMIRSSSTLSSTASSSSPSLAPEVQQSSSKRNYNVNTQHPTNRVAVSVSGGEPPFQKLMACNRGEIAVRISRGAAELGIQTAAIYSNEGTDGPCV